MPPRPLLLRLLQLPQSRILWWTTDCWQALHEQNRQYRYYSMQPSQANFISYKKLRLQARRVIKEAKCSRWRQFISQINRNTPLTQVWSTITLLNNKRPYNAITTIKIDNHTIDGQPSTAIGTARHFEAASSTNSHPRIFLATKVDAEQTLTLQQKTWTRITTPRTRWINFQLLALKSCRDSSQILSQLIFAMIKNFNPPSVAKLLTLYNHIWTSHQYPQAICPCRPHP